MNEQIAANETATAAKPRKGWVAFLLSIFWPGLGQIYAGAPLRAVVVFGLYLFVIVPFVFLIRTSLTRTLAGFFVFAVLTVIAVYLLVPVDSLLTARRRRSRPLSRWNRVWVYVVYAVLASVILAFAIPWISTLLPVRAFTIPSGAMMDTLLVGDVILADMGRGPLRSLERGEIVVFDMPREPEVMYIKRLMGLPGDTIAVRNGYLYVNDTKLEEPYINEDYLLDVPDFGPARIKEGHYFMLGDHRNASYDSRDWGTVPEKLLRGRALHVYYSYSATDRLGASLGPIRWDRFGKSLSTPD